MPKAKIAITIDARALKRIDRLVHEGRHPNRSQAIEAAIDEHLDRVEHRRLAEQCAKLDRRAEVKLAEEGLGTDLATWPAY